MKGRDTRSAHRDCPICGWSADTLATELHMKRCQQWKRACYELGFAPMTGPAARRAILTARRAYYACSSLLERQVVVKALTRALFDLSLGLAIKEGYHSLHPSLEDFRRMLKIPEFSSKLRAPYPYKDGHIAPGATVWHPPGSRARKIQMEASESHKKA